jgi:hypothetical protein
VKGHRERWQIRISQTAEIELKYLPPSKRIQTGKHHRFGDCSPRGPRNRDAPDEPDHFARSSFPHHRPTGRAGIGLAECEGRPKLIGAAMDDDSARFVRSGREDGLAGPFKASIGCGTRSRIVVVPRWRDMEDLFCP